MLLVEVRSIDSYDFILMLSQICVQLLDHVDWKLSRHLCLLSGFLFLFLYIFEQVRVIYPHLFKGFSLYRLNSLNFGLRRRHSNRLNAAFPFRCTLTGFKRPLKLLASRFDRRFGLRLYLLYDNFIFFLAYFSAADFAFSSFGLGFDEPRALPYLILATVLALAYHWYEYD